MWPCLEHNPAEFPMKTACLRQLSSGIGNGEALTGHAEIDEPVASYRRPEAEEAEHETTRPEDQREAKILAANYSGSFPFC